MQNTTPTFHNPDGTLTGYSFTCGYVERYGEEDFPRATIYREPNNYHVKGYTSEGAHFWEVFTSVSEARRFAKRAAGALKKPRY